MKKIYFNINGTRYYLLGLLTGCSSMKDDQNS